MHYFNFSSRSRFNVESEKNISDSEPDSCENNDENKYIFHKIEVILKHYMHIASLFKY